MQGGAGIGLFLLVATPIVWAVPVALMTAELASAIPEEGGYYVWVRDAMGPFPGFLCAWWSWVYSWLDTALYPTLFFAYLHTLWQELALTSAGEANPWLKWAMGLPVIVPLTFLNIRGAKPTGRAAVVLGGILLLPFLALCFIGLPAAISHPPTVLVAPGKTVSEALGAGIFVVMWNYLGFDSMSTVAGEVDRPRWAFPRALLIAVPLVTACYAVPVFVGVANYPDLSKWNEGAWTSVARAIGGPWLAIAITIAGALSAAGMFGADLLSASRLPLVLAEDGLLPPALSRLSPKYGTPVAAIGISALLCTVLSFESFTKLLEVDVVMYSAALILEFVALVVLRWKRPDQIGRAHV